MNNCNNVSHPGFATQASPKASPRREGFAEASSRRMNTMRVFVMIAGLPAMLRTRPQRWRVATAGWVALQAGLLWFGALTLWADTHYVSLDGTNDSVNGYITWSGAATQIQWAVSAAGVNDTVLVSNGIYNLTNRISIAANITVRSLNGTNVTIVDGGYPAMTNQCFYMTAGTLDGFTIRNGCTTNITTQEGGGGVQLNGININVLNCLIYGNCVTNTNSAPFWYVGGGGIFLSDSCNGSIISNCTIVSNAVSSGSSGGGIGLWSEGLIVASRISGNWAPTAGGIFMIHGTV
ncbi:hypothetical protein KKC04_04425, partial [Patescibacteria group bacterium]|nr:hypothetical protein [Patescibacteria group bacterium]